MKSYFDEFDKKYNRPSMDKITVGFSGIDPAPKGFTEATEIAIDAGEITVDAGEITVDSGEIV